MLEARNTALESGLRTKSTEPPTFESRRAKVTLERTDQLETFYDLTVLLTHALDTGTVPRSLFPDSRAIMDAVIVWTNDFNELFSYEYWDSGDYIQTVERWFDLQVRIMRRADPRFAD